MNQKQASSRLDNKKEIHHPIDYSFKTLSSFEDMLREKQRLRAPDGSMILEDDILAEDSSISLDIVKSNTSALKVNNNMLTIWDGFSNVISKLFVDPAITLAWIDVSFNDLRTIDAALLELPNLTMLYIHGNNIYSIVQIDKLRSLSKLRSLTLHGNPVEVSPGYRQYIISGVPQLQTLDFSGITKADRLTAQSWRTIFGQKTKIKKKKN